MGIMTFTSQNEHMDDDAYFTGALFVSDHTTLFRILELPLWQLKGRCFVFGETDMFIYVSLVQQIH